jgi:glycosyltransferase involved in cell wall biosynthesis
MKLLVFTENYVRGGGNRYLIDLINSVAGEYEEIVLVSNRGGIFSEDTARLVRPVRTENAFFVTRARVRAAISGLPKWARVPLLLPISLLSPILFLGNLASLALLLRRERPSRVLACNGGYPAARACLTTVIAARLLHIPNALSIVSTPAGRGPFGMLERLVDRLVWRSVDRVLVNARSIAIALCAQRDAPMDKVTVVHNGIEDRPSPSPDAGDEPASTQGSAAQSPAFVVGCVARMDAAKGVLYLFDAFASLAQQHPQLQLVLAGQGDASAELQRRIRAAGFQDRVRMLGHYSGDTQALLASFDAYVFPSLWEGFPYSILEALRGGCSIVATKVGGIPEAITDGVEGLLIEPASSQAIGSALERLIADKALRQALARNARLRFESEFDLRRMHRLVAAVIGPENFISSPKGILEGSGGRS